MTLKKDIKTVSGSIKALELEYLAGESSSNQQLVGVFEKNTVAAISCDTESKSYREGNQMSKCFFNVFGCNNAV